MPLLCISLLVLVLLPLSLCCDKNLSAFQDLSMILPAQMENIRKNLTKELKDISCQELKNKVPNCTAQTEEADIMETLFLQACDMFRLKLQPMKTMAEVVQTSLKRHCPTKHPRLHRGATPRNRAGKKMRKLCKANAILSSMTVCYEKLNMLCRT